MALIQIVAPKTRWQLADDNFRKQIDMLMAVMGTKNKARVAEEAGIERCTFYNRYRRPGTLTKCEERMLASLFERNGLHYDMTQGEGAATC